MATSLVQNEIFFLKKKKKQEALLKYSFKVI